MRLGFVTYHMFFLSGLVRKWLNGQHRVLIVCATRRDSPDALNDSFSSARTTKRLPAASMRVSNEECSPTRLGHTFRPIHVARCIVNTNHDIM
jgi:hypothetical protein